MGNSEAKGFTLLEMLLVLFAISVLSVVTYFHVHSLYEKQKLNNFKTVSNDILYMQQLAINRQKHYTLRWHKDRHMYYIGNRVRIILSLKENMIAIYNWI